MQKLLPVLLLLIPAPAIIAQPSLPKLEFEVASVRLSSGVPGGFNMRGGPGTDDPGRVTMQRFPMESLILTAFDLKTFQLAGPDWIMGNFGATAVKVDITAKLPDGTTKEQFQIMLQNLLADRFGMKVHHEMKEMQLYDLVLAKNGPKFKPSPVDIPSGKVVAPDGSQRVTIGPDGFPVLPPGYSMAWVKDRARMRATKETMAGFAQKLSAQMDQPVRDLTGLKGEYDFELFWLPDSVAAADLSLGPTLTQAVQDQLGLRLESKKGLSDVLIIDHIEKAPTDN